MITLETIKNILKNKSFSKKNLPSLLPPASYLLPKEQGFLLVL
jgi:hypothetical protein